jgi:hypothetical protein
LTRKRAEPEEQPEQPGELSCSVQYWEDPPGRSTVADWIRSTLSPYEQAVVVAAINNILVPLGINICSTEWGKALGGGLFEFRIRASLQAAAIPLERPLPNWPQPSMLALCSSWTILQPWDHDLLISISRRPESRERIRHP